MSATVIVPETVPEVAGHVGFPPPPHRNATMPPFTLVWPKWICANDTALDIPSR
jgi:hypothetical protein